MSTTSGSEKNNLMPIKYQVHVYVFRTFGFRSLTITTTMLSRKLFQTEDESDVMPALLSTLKFELTPGKSDIMSVMTPSIKRSLFPDSDLKQQISTRLQKSTKRIREDVDEEMICQKRNKKLYELKTVVNTLAENDHMIADGSRPHVPPTIHGKQPRPQMHPPPQTLADVVNGVCNDLIVSYRIIDCRYPYEYEGGHISGAENMYLHETILTLLQQPTSEKQILIFHCEFSSERGSKMPRFLRRKDRDLNKENYPSLNYPEVYLLDGGYKSFFNELSELCDPINYRPMLHSDHSADLRHFRAKSKSWTAGEKRRFARKAMRF